MTEALVAVPPVLATPAAVASGIGGAAGGGGKDASAMPAASGVGKREDSEEMSAAKSPELKDKTAQPGGGGEDVMIRDARDAAASLPPTANVAEPLTKVLAWRVSLRTCPCACWPCACVSIVAPIHCGTMTHSLRHGVHSCLCVRLSLMPRIHALKSAARAPKRSCSFSPHAYVLFRVRAGLLAMGCVGAGARGGCNRGISGWRFAAGGADGRRQVIACAAHPTPLWPPLCRGARSLAYSVHSARVL